MTDYVNPFATQECPYAKRARKRREIAEIMSQSGCFGSIGRLTAVVEDFFDPTNNSMTPEREAVVVAAIKIWESRQA